MPKVTVKQLEKTVELQANGTPLLDSLEAKGLTMPFGCRSGSCGACRVIVHKGEDSLLPATALEIDTVSRCEDEGIVRLACRAMLKPGVTEDLVVESSPEVLASLKAGTGYY